MEDDTEIPPEAVPARNVDELIDNIMMQMQVLIERQNELEARIESDASNDRGIPDTGNEPASVPDVQPDTTDGNPETETSHESGDRIRHPKRQHPYFRKLW